MDPKMMIKSTLNDLFLLPIGFVVLGKTPILTCFFLIALKTAFFFQNCREMCREGTCIAYDIISDRVLIQFDTFSVHPADGNIQPEKIQATF